jgi:CDP-diacylglycerol--glycerol-3-phosphate 3-phosphatidyltransferase
MQKLVLGLTLSRIISGPILFFAIALNYFGLAFFIFISASITDYLDGHLARKHDVTSALGEVLDPVADKIIVIFIIFAIAIHLESLYVSLVGSIILSRDIWVGSLRDLNARIGNIAATKVSWFAKLKTAFQLITFSAYIFALYLNNELFIFTCHFFLFATMIASLSSAFDYTVSTFIKKK